MLKMVLPAVSFAHAEGLSGELAAASRYTGVPVQNELLKELGPEISTNVEELLHCCQAAKNAGYVGAYMAGKDTRSPLMC